MNRISRFVAAACVVLAMWILALVWLGQRIEGDLSRTAKELLTADAEAKEKFQSVTVVPEGQEITLRGSVQSEEARAEAEKIVKNYVRSGARPLPWPAANWSYAAALNPVTNVINELSVGKQLPEVPGWLMLSVHRDLFTLTGKVKDYQAQQKMSEKYGREFTKLIPAEKIEVSESVTAREPKELTTPTPEERENGWIAICSLGKPWRIISGADNPENLKIKQELVEADKLNWSLVTNQLDKMKRPQGIPSRIVVGVADKNVYYSGTVSDAAAKDALEAALKAKYPAPMVVDGSILVDPKLSSPGTAIGLAAFAAALPKPPIAGGPEMLLATLNGEVQGRQRTKEDLASATEAAKGLSPLGLDPRVVATHIAELLPQLREATEKMPPLVAANIVLASVSSDPKKVVVGGDVPDQAAKDALLAALKKKYEGVEIGDRLRVTLGATLFKDAKDNNQTIDTIPELSKNATQPYTLGLAQLGGPWNSRPFGTLAEAKDPDQYAGFIPRDAKPDLKTKLSQEFGLAIADLPVPTPPTPPTPPANPSAAKEEPVVNLFGENKLLRVAGEVADENTKAKIVETLTAKWTGWKIDPASLVVTPEVKPTADLTAALDKLPAPTTDGKRFVSMARFGEAARNNVVHSIYFATGQSEWSRDRDRALAQVKRILQFSPQAKFEISGHTDSQGDPEANQKLSENRAQTLSEYFAQQGVPATALTTRGAGANEPIGDNANDQGRALNRRVDITIK